MYWTNYTATSVELLYQLAIYFKKYKKKKIKNKTTKWLKPFKINFFEILKKVGQFLIVLILE